jgi:hypothetical protein
MFDSPRSEARLIAAGKLGPQLLELLTLLDQVERELLDLLE